MPTGPHRRSAAAQDQSRSAFRQAQWGGIPLSRDDVPFRSGFFGKPRGLREPREPHPAQAGLLVPCRGRQLVRHIWLTPENWVVSASAEVKAAQPRAWRSSLARRAPAIVAVVLVLLGVIAVAVRLDAPSDGTVVSFYRVDGVVVDVPSTVDGSGLQSGDVVIEIAGQRLANGVGGLARPQLGDEL